MSFLEFLFEYYWYILAVLCVLIVGVIGFLVDSKNMADIKKNKKNESTDNGVDSVKILKNDIASEPLSMVQDMSGKGENLKQTSIKQLSSNDVIVSQNVGVSPGDDYLKIQNVGNGYSNWQTAQFGNRDYINDYSSTDNFNMGMENSSLDGGIMYNVNGVISNTVNSSVDNRGVTNNMSTNNITSGMTWGYSQELGTEPVNNNFGVTNASYSNNVGNTSQFLQNGIPVNDVNTGNSPMSNFSIQGVSPSVDGVQQSINSSCNNSYSVITDENRAVSSMVNGGNLQSSMMNAGVNLNANNSNQVNGNSNENIPSSINNVNSSIVNNVFTSDGKEPFDISSMFANNQ